MKKTERGSWAPACISLLPDGGHMWQQSRAPATVPSLLWRTSHKVGANTSPSSWKLHLKRDFAIVKRKVTNIHGLPRRCESGSPKTKPKVQGLFLGKEANKAETEYWDRFLPTSKLFPGSTFCWSLVSTPSWWALVAFLETQFRDKYSCKRCKIPIFYEHTNQNFVCLSLQTWHHYDKLVLSISHCSWQRTVVFGRRNDP